MGKRKLRSTKQRRIILEELNKLDSHPTADELYDRVRKLLPRISMGTVYRNLEVLSDCGMIQRVEPRHSQMRFDSNVDDHFHITCKKCGKMEDLTIELSSDIKESLQHHTDFDIDGYRLDLVGVCPRCANGEGTDGPEIDE